MGGSVHRFRERPCIPWLLDHALSGAPSSSAEWPSQSYCLPCAWTPARRASPPLRGRVARVGGVVRMLRCGWTSSVGGTCSFGLSKAPPKHVLGLHAQSANTSHTAGTPL